MFEAYLPGFMSFRAALTMTGENIQRSITLQIASLEETVTAIDKAGEIDASGSAPAQTGNPRANPKCPSSPPGGDIPMGGNIRVPQKIRHGQPQYPASLRGTGAEGVVVVDGRIGLDGLMTDIRVHEPANAEFAGALVTAVSQWQWDSTLLNCVPMEVLITVTGAFLPQQ